MVLDPLSQIMTVEEEKVSTYRRAKLSRVFKLMKINSK